MKYFICSFRAFTLIVENAKDGNTYFNNKAANMSI